MDFDETRLYYSHQQLQTESDRNQTGGPDADDDARRRQQIDDDDSGVNLRACRNHFREFLRNYRLGQHGYLYREKLLRMHRRLSRRPARAASGGDENNGNNTDAMNADASRNANSAKLQVDLAHVGEYDGALLGYLLHQPAAILPELERAASDALQTLLYDMQSGSSNQDGIDNAGGLDATATATDSNTTVFVQSIQVLLTGNLRPTPLRKIKSEHMNRLLQCPGICISTSPVKNRATRLTVRCHRCLDTQTIAATEGPFGSIRLPSQCSGSGAGAAARNNNNDGGGGNDGNENGNTSDCGRYPFAVVPDQCQFCDQQTLKLQEAPEKVPTGEMPRSVLAVVERALVDIAPPGTRVTCLCIPTLFTTSHGGGGGGKGNQQKESKAVYLRVVGMIKDNDAHGQAVTFTPAEEEAFTQLARSSSVYDVLSRSIAPNISGSYTVDIKKALACQLLSGSRKRLPDGVRLRGDINVLLLGDPSMAKSQFLKFISKVAPVGIYTSGKGSSAAGLTASVVKDSKGEFYLEGGAMVLADGGIVCIDEFDKMRPNDRVAIHEAMEQQTISVAKAGITTVLNSRSSVLAAANPVFGRYDDMRSASENIDMMTTILSRFDLIFLVRDVREEERDRMICQHVMGVHINSSRDNATSGSHMMSSSGAEDGDAGGVGFGDVLGHAAPGATGGAASSTPEAIAENVMQVVTTGQGELDVPAMKKYIQYCKAKCSPRLSEEAGDVLTSSYVKIRDDVRKQAIAAAGQSGDDQDTQAAIPITVRQLEALVRLSESLAKMRLDSQVRSEDVTEALRLFKVSTMAANDADQNMGDGSSAGMVPGAVPNREEMERTESFLKSRLSVGTMVNKQRLVEEAAGLGFNAMLVARALSIMANRGELLERNKGRLLKRIK